MVWGACVASRTNECLKTAVFIVANSYDGALKLRREGAASAGSAHLLGFSSGFSGGLFEALSVIFPFI